MFKNYFKTAFRNLRKNKTYSLINIIGLALGTLCCLYILLYVKYQYSYDIQHRGARDIYRINTLLTLTGDKHSSAAASPPIAPAMKNDFPEVRQFTRVINTGLLGAKEHLLSYKENSFYEKDALYVDSTFFDIFTYHFSNGNPVSALNEPYSVVLMKPVADKLFGDEDPINKVIEINDAYGKHAFKVTGVFDESLGPTHLKANMFITMNSGGIGQYVLQNNSWAGNNFAYEYVKLNHHADVAALERKFPAFLNKYGEQQLKELGMQKQLVLEPVTSIHTTTGYENEMDKTVSPSFLNILILIAVLIQIIACINFMNLSTARASKRAKEVGVRKVIGAGKIDLIKQFLGESFLLSFIGVVIALPLLLFALPFFDQITQAHIQVSLLKDYRIWLILASLIITTGLVAGSYPAFYLSAFQAVKAIKGNFTNHVSAAGIRKTLVVFQFVLSIVLIVGIIVIYDQMHFINHKDLGFDKSQRLIFSFYTDVSKNKMPSFAEDLRQLADVRTVSASNNYLGQFIAQDHGVYLEGGSEATATDVQNISTDKYFVKAYGIKIIGGRDFRQNDSGKVLINTTLMKRLGLTLQDAPGTKLYTHYQPNPETYVEVAGVMKDFNYNSLHNDIRPFMLVYDPRRDDISDLTVAVNSSDYKSLLGKIETQWHKDLPGTPFYYSFLDEDVQKQYETEITLSNIINSFTFMAILISCLGLLGLAAFSAEQKRKEIGIRKVLGASVPGIVQLLSKDFLKLVGIAILIATPIAWWSMNKWLQGFAYRIEMSWWIFLCSGFVAILIALLTVSFQAIKAAVANPVKSLRSE